MFRSVPLWCTTLALLLAVAVVTLLLSGCAPLLTGQTTADDIVKVLEKQNVNGCLYVRGATLPTGAITVHALGTVGPTPPPLAECAKALGLSP